MRLLYIVHQYLPDHIGGTELYTHWLTSEMARRGHQVAVFHRRDGATGLEHRLEGAIDIWAINTGPFSATSRFLATFGKPSIQSAWEHVQEKFNPDLVHIQHLMGLPVSLVRHLWQQRIPYAVTLWDYWWLCPNAQLLTNYSGEICDGPRDYRNCARCALARAGHPRLWVASPFLAGLMARRNHLLQQVMGAAKVLIAPTDFVYQWYVAHGVSETKIVVIPPGLVYPAARLNMPRQPDGIIRFAYIGGLAWQKGVHVLLESFAGVRGPAELWIAGDETFDPTYTSRLHNLASSRVRFLGRLDREQIGDLLSQIDVVTVPSLWYETFSFLISEAFASGLPVVASRLGPLADRVRDGIDGLLIPAGDVAAWRAAMQRLVDEPGLLARLRASVCQPMTMEEHVDRLEELYGEIFDKVPRYGIISNAREPQN